MPKYDGDIWAMENCVQRMIFRAHWNLSSFAARSPFHTTIPLAWYKQYRPIFHREFCVSVGVFCLFFYILHCAGTLEFIELQAFSLNMNNGRNYEYQIIMDIEYSVMDAHHDSVMKILACYFSSNAVMVFYASSR